MEIRNITGARELNVLLNESYRNNTRIKLTDQDHVAIYAPASNPMSRLVSWFRQALGITRREQEAVARRLQDLVDQSPAPAEPAGITRRVRAVSNANAATAPASSPTNSPEAFTQERIYAVIDDPQEHATAPTAFAQEAHLPENLPKEALYATVNKGKVVESDEPPQLPPRNYLMAESEEQKPAETITATASPALQTAQDSGPDTDADTKAAMERDAARKIGLLLQGLMAPEKVRKDIVDMSRPQRSVRLGAAVVDFIHQSTAPLTEEMRSERAKILKHVGAFLREIDKAISLQKWEPGTEEKAEIELFRKKLENQEFLNITAKTSNPVKRESGVSEGNGHAIRQLIEPANTLFQQLDNFTDSECLKGMPGIANQLLAQRSRELTEIRDSLQRTKPESEALQTINSYLNAIQTVTVEKKS